MSILRQYQTYYPISLIHWELDWAGSTYNELLVKDYPTDYLESNDYIDDTSASFIYPSMYANKYYLDGIAEGHISIYNASTTPDDDGEIDDYTVALVSTPDEANAETEIFSITRTLSASNSVATESYLSLPIYASIDKKLVNANEKLILTIEFTDAATGGDLQIACANIQTGGSDAEIKIPYAPTG